MAYVKSEQNKLRAGWARDALVAFGEDTRAQVEHDLNFRECRDEIITDLICDLLHYAEQNGNDGPLLLKTALAGFEIESEGEI